MAITPNTVVRLKPALIADAREAAGLPATTPVSHLVRLALAMLAGRPDPQAEMVQPRGAAARPASGVPVISP